MKFQDFFGTANYISANGEYQFPYLRKGFTLNERVKKATLYVSVLGFGELYVNGKRINEELYITPYSQYNAQGREDNNALPDDVFFFDELGYTVYVSEYDVTDALATGKNALGIIVAGGWYRSGKDLYGNYRNFGKTGACFRLCIETVSGKKVEILSDTACRWKESFLLQAGIFHEEQDERKEIFNFSIADYDDGEWQAVQTLSAPQAEYLPLDCPPNKVIRTVNAKLIKQTENYKIYDMGENLTGVPVVLSSGAAGDKIVCSYSEEILENGELDPKNIFCQETVFLTDGRREHKLRFTWHGFRYLKIFSENGDARLDCKFCEVVHAAVKNTSAFECDDETLTWLYEAYARTQLENYQCGVPTDCPQIERKGYTGDGQLLCELGMRMFDAKRLYKKWIRDICDAQDRKTGFVQYTAPCFIGCAGGPGGWSVAIVNVPYAYYKAYGDLTVLWECYPYMKKYAQFMTENAPLGLVAYKNRECLGDWNAPWREQLPSRFANTCMFVDALYTLQKVAALLGKDEDRTVYQEEIERCKRAIDKAYFDEDTGDYCFGEQAANAFALKIGLGDDRTKKNLIKRYRALKKFDTGIFGTKYLAETICKAGEGDLFYDLINSDDFASYKTWKKQGATTLQEAWKYGRSHNHPMFGAPVLNFFEYILGIRQTETSAGFAEIIIQPLKISALRRAAGKISTERGEISVAYQDTQSGRVFTICVPQGISCKFSYAGYERDLTAGVYEFTV